MLLSILDTHRQHTLTDTRLQASVSGLGRGRRSLNFIDHCEKIAKEHFAIGELRPAQKQVFALMEKHPYVLATLPTGSGKTLLYAAPSLIGDQGVVLVISPLISLMRDQARRMKDANIPCVAMTSEQSEEERREAWALLRSKRVKIVFASPERFVLPSFLNLISQLNLKMAVVDEAHCVISWGHQFRPEYAEIGNYLSKLNPPRILAITATASRHSRTDIIKKVFPAQAVVAEFTSHPLSPHVHVKSIRAFSFDEQWHTLVGLLRKSSSYKSIVYFQTRKLCEEYAKKLRQEKIPAVIYHAGLSKYDRSQTEQYIHNATQNIVICATTAFGMGVDVAGIRMVIVYGFPSTIEELFQMWGRAGRAGEASEGILLWTGRDPMTRRYHFKYAFPTTTVFLQIVTKLSGLMPKRQHEQVLVERRIVCQTLEQGSTEGTKYTEGTLSGLRICGLLEDPSLRLSYLQIQLDRNTALSGLLAELPEGPTKRKKVLDAIAGLIHPSVLSLPAAQIVLPVSFIVDASQQNEQTIQQVLSYYAEKSKLSVTQIQPTISNPYVLLKHHPLALQKELPRYINARNYFFSSLQHVETLSTATECRLAASYEFFSARRLQGASQKRYLCMQCDLCLKGNTPVHP